MGGTATTKANQTNRSPATPSTTSSTAHTKSGAATTKENRSTAAPTTTDSTANTQSGTATTKANPSTAAPTTKTTTDTEDSVDINDVWAEWNQAMEKLRQQIQACPGWIEHSSTDVTEGGLYCKESSTDKYYKCSKNPLEGDNISTDTCPEDVGPRLLIL